MSVPIQKHIENVCNSAMYKSGDSFSQALILSRCRGIKFTSRMHDVLHKMVELNLLSCNNDRENMLYRKNVNISHLATWPTDVADEIRDLYQLHALVGEAASQVIRRNP